MNQQFFTSFSCLHLVSTDMMKFLIFFAFFVFVDIPDVQSEFVTLWTPKFVQEDAAYRLSVLPTGLSQETDIGVQFRSSNASFTMVDGKVGAVEYGSIQRNFGNITSFDLTMTLLRNVTTSSGIEQRCSTKQIDVQTKTGNFYNFIQTDKPIYKPGDVVQFRILTVDKNLYPFHRNSINVTVTDPSGRPIYNFVNQKDKYFGVFDDNFTLSTSTSLGDWMITVIVDKKEHLAVSKIFAVQKYILPLFAPYIDLPELHVLKDADLMYSVYAKYSFGEFVKGTAEVTIRRKIDKHVYSTEIFRNVYEPKVVVKNLRSIGVQTNTQVELEAYVVFTEPSSGMHFNKTVAFHAHSDEQNILKVSHTDRFIPGFPFTLKVMINNWKNEQIMGHFEKIELIYSYKLANGSYGDTVFLGILRNGVYKHEFEVPMDYTALSVDVKFPNSPPYRKVIQKGQVSVGINVLNVRHTPTNPALYDIVKIYVSHDEPLNDIVYSIVTRYGNSLTKQVKCNMKKMCIFEIEVDDKMMPQSTILVYDVRNQQTIYQGQDEIKTENLGINFLTVDLSTAKAKTKEEVEFKFSTKSKSKIYMLAFDKRLTFLRDGNDIVKEDVITTVANYDGENKILIDDMTSWTVCTPEEVTRVRSGMTYVINQGGTDTYYPTEKDDDMSPTQNGLPATNFPKTTDGLLREYFPETWIFETIEVGSKSKIDKSFITPDSMTTWLISAFSVNSDYGLALSPRQDLIVMNEFFVEMNLPYSIRYTEVLKLEILVFNYIDTKETITVDLKLNNLNDGMEFQFVEYNAQCQPKYNDGSVASTKVTVGPKGVATTNETEINDT
ncbi:CD109 antigen-like [Chironomus tepperi]|uniref:CD109 antigen-like n=1 Tax=Chironomus tepperi TaxID=113505 RepID=UPI00391F1B7F